MQVVITAATAAANVVGPKADSQLFDGPPPAGAGVAVDVNETTTFPRPATKDLLLKLTPCSGNPASFNACFAALCGVPVTDGCKAAVAECMGEDVTVVSGAVVVELVSGAVVVELATVDNAEVVEVVPAGADVDVSGADVVWGSSDSVFDGACGTSSDAGSFLCTGRFLYSGHRAGAKPTWFRLQSNMTS